MQKIGILEGEMKFLSILCHFQGSKVWLIVTLEVFDFVEKSKEASLKVHLKIYNVELFFRKPEKLFAQFGIFLLG